MDSIITYWQEITSLSIVTAAAVLMIRSEVIRRKNKNDCGNCALIEIRARQRYTLRK